MTRVKREPLLVGKIEKGVPLPPRCHRTKYPWKEMKVGDSFLVKNKPTQYVSTVAWAYGKSHDMHFIVRPTPDGVRVWRDK